MHKAGIPSIFGSRIEPQQGHIQATLARQQQAAAGQVASALDGSVLQLRFKAVKAMSSTEVSLLGANPGGTDPAPVLPVNTRIMVGQ